MTSKRNKADIDSQVAQERAAWDADAEVEEQSAMAAPKAKQGWIGVDLDATLAYYDGWKGVEHIGEHGTWRCLANVGGALCVAEVFITVKQ